MTMRQTFIEATTAWLDDDPLAVVLLADIGVGRFEAEGALARHPDRIVNVGIREALAVGAAAGWALEGFRPLVHTYAPFLVERAFEQIKLDLVHQSLNATLVSIGGSFEAATEGRTHQAPGDVALLGTLPGVRVEVPGHPEEVAPSLARARAHNGTTYVRLSESANRRPHAPLERVREGRRGTVVAIGPMLDPTLAATADLDLGIVYCGTALPFTAGLSEIVGEGALAVVEPYLEGTSLPFLIEALGPRPLLALGVGRTELRRYGHADDHARAHQLDPAGLRARLVSAWPDLRN